jgi:hypothetical protein
MSHFKLIPMILALFTSLAMLLFPLGCDLGANKDDSKSKISALSALLTFRSAPVLECTLDTDCPAGKACIGKTCVVPECMVTADCHDNKVCADHTCVQRPISHCEEVGGYCESASGECAETYIMWTPCGCPGGNDGACCYPSDSCTAIGGTCMDVLDTCPAGSESAGPLNCGLNTQCCIPLD